MYIHNYQIHNVLNAYRKQLSRSPVKTGAERPIQADSGNVAAPSQKGKPPAIVNQISTEIIDRIARFGPKSEFDNAVANQLASPKSEDGEHSGIDFTYSMIDEQNRKITQTLPMNSLNSFKYQDVQNAPAAQNITKEQAPVNRMLDNNQETQSEWKG